MKRLILTALAAASLGGCADYGGIAYPSTYVSNGYYVNGQYCPSGYYCDGAGTRQLIPSGGYYGNSWNRGYQAPAHSYQPRQQMSCPAGYVNDGGGCALAQRGNQGGWNDSSRHHPQSNWSGNGSTYQYQRQEGRVVERTRERNDGSETRVVERRQMRNDTRSNASRPANQTYTPYNYNGGYQGYSYPQQDRRVVERTRERNDGSETRVVQRTRERSDSDNRRDRPERRRNN